MQGRRPTKKIAIALPLASEVGVVAITQLLPMIAMSVTDYAKYTGIYLLFGVMYGIVLAVICDVWARSNRMQDSAERTRTEQTQTGHGLDGRGFVGGYSRALAQSALIAGVINGSLAALVVEPPLAAIAGAATVLGIMRSGNRYRLLAHGATAKAGLVDLAGVLAGAACWIIMVLAGSSGIAIALAAWFATSLVSVILSSEPRQAHNGGLWHWVQAHWNDIRLLLGDALILNFSSVATPYVAAIVGGTSAMALVRSSTSLLYPVRLILGIFRPRIIARGSGSNLRSMMAVAALGSVLGALTGAGLYVSRQLQLFSESTFGLLSAFPIEIAILSASSAVSVFSQFEARGRLPARGLLWRRTLHTALLIVVLATAVYMGGPAWSPGALALATALSIPIWAVRSAKPKSIQIQEKDK